MRLRDWRLITKPSSAPQMSGHPPWCNARKGEGVDPVYVSGALEQTTNQTSRPSHHRVLTMRFLIHGLFYTLDLSYMGCIRHGIVTCLSGSFRSICLTNYREKLFWHDQRLNPSRRTTRDGWTDEKSLETHDFSLMFNHPNPFQSPIPHPPIYNPIYQQQPQILPIQQQHPPNLLYRPRNNNKHNPSK